MSLDYTDLYDFMFRNGSLLPNAPRNMVMSTLMGGSGIPGGLSVDDDRYIKQVLMPHYHQLEYEHYQRVIGQLEGTSSAIASRLGVDENKIKRAREAVSKATYDKGSRDIILNVGRMITGSAPGKAIMGGDSSAIFKSMLVNSQSLTPRIGASASEADFIRLASIGHISRSVHDVMYGRPGGGKSATPNRSFSQGFSAEDMGELTSLALPHMGDLGAQLSRASNNFSDIDSDAFNDLLDELNDNIGEVAKIARAVSNFSGKTNIKDIQRIMTSFGLDKNLTAAGLSTSVVDVINMQAMAQNMGIDKDLATSMWQATRMGLQSGLGLTQAHIDAGFTGGGLASLRVTNEVVMRGRMAALAAGATTPKEMAEYVARHSVLNAKATESSAGRAARIIAYHHQQGLISDADMQAFVAASESGAVLARDQFIDKFFTQRFGSVAQGRQMMMDANYMAMVDQNTSESTGILLSDTIYKGRIADWNARNIRDQRKDLVRHVKGATMRVGIIPGGEKESEVRTRAVLSAMDDDARAVLSDTIIQMRAEGKTETEIHNHIQGLLGGSTYGKYAKDARERADYAGATYNLDVLRDRGRAAAETKTALAIFRENAIGSMDQRDEISQLLQSDPKAARERIDAMLQDEALWQGGIGQRKLAFIKSSITASGDVATGEIDALDYKQRAVEMLNTAASQGITGERLHEDLDVMLKSLYAVQQAAPGERQGAINKFKDLTGSMRGFAPTVMSEINAAVESGDPELLAKVMARHHGVLGVLTGSSAGTLSASGETVMDAKDITEGAAGVELRKVSGTDARDAQTANKLAKEYEEGGQKDRASWWQRGVEWLADKGSRFSGGVDKANAWLDSAEDTFGGAAKKYGRIPMAAATLGASEVFNMFGGMQKSMELTGTIQIIDSAGKASTGNLRAGVRK